MSVTTDLLVKGIARGEIQKIVRNIDSLAGLWQQRYNAAGLVLFTAAELLKLEEALTMFGNKLIEQKPPAPNT